MHFQILFICFQYITDEGVELCGTLCLSLEPIPMTNPRRGEPREIVAKMLFGDTEIKASAKDVLTQQTVKVKHITVTPITLMHISIEMGENQNFMQYFQYFI